MEIWCDLLFLLLTSRSATPEGQADGQMEWPFPHWLECDLTLQEDPIVVTPVHIPILLTKYSHTFYKDSLYLFIYLFLV